MNQPRTYSSPLRERQTEDTRRRIVEAALELIQEDPDGSFSHEQIAARAEIALRTVYRHFPSRTELLDAVWQESDRRLQLTNYPDTEQALLASLDPVFGTMDRNADLMRGLLRSNAGQEMRRRDNERRRSGVVKALAGVTSHLSNDERRRVTAVFQALYSARTWEMMRDRAHLNDGESAQAIAWAMNTLLDALRRQGKKERAPGPAARKKASSAKATSAA